MNLTSPKEVVALLETQGIRPNKVLGQNFLIDRNILDTIVGAAALEPGDAVLEVGPGLGVLTEQLLEKAGTVTAIEKDGGLYRILAERWGQNPKLTLLHADALDVDIGEMFAHGITRLVSNLPYVVGVRVVVNAALCDVPPEVMVVLLQKEVAERFVAAPGTSDRGTVSIWLQMLYDITLVKTVKPACFYPRPEVVSTVIQLKRHQRYSLDARTREKLIDLTKFAFLHRRKQLASSFRDAPSPLARDADWTRLALVKCGVKETARPEELTVPQWIELTQCWMESDA